MRGHEHPPPLSHPFRHSCAPPPSFLRRQEPAQPTTDRTTPNIRQRREAPQSGRREAEAHSSKAGRPDSCLRRNDGSVNPPTPTPAPFPNSSLPPSRGEVRWGVEAREPRTKPRSQPDPPPATPAPPSRHSCAGRNHPPPLNNPPPSPIHPSPLPGGRLGGGWESRASTAAVPHPIRHSCAGRNPRSRRPIAPIPSIRQRREAPRSGRREVGARSSAGMTESGCARGDLKSPTDIREPRLHHLFQRRVEREHPVADFVEPLLRVVDHAVDLHAYRAV